MRLAVCLFVALALSSCAFADGGHRMGSAKPPDPSAEATSLLSGAVDPSSVSAAEASPVPSVLTPAPEPILTASALADFAEQFGPATSLAVTDLRDGSVLATSEPPTPFAWSTAKVLIVVRILMDAGGVEGIDPEESRDIDAALTRSDNEAAARLWTRLVLRFGSPEGAATALNEVLRAGGDSQTQVSTVGRGWFSPYGQTHWGIGDQVRFFKALFQGCVLSERDTGWLVAVMNRVVPEQRWGLLRSWDTVGKGGWGPDPDGTYLVRQVAILTASNGGQYVAAVATRAAGGDFAAGTRVLDDVEAWLRVNLREAPMPLACSSPSGSPCCATGE